MSNPYEITLSLPEDRIGVFIGKSGKIKKTLEKILNIKIVVNSKKGEVKIILNSIDPIKEWKIKHIIEAITYGYPPEIALMLEDDQYLLYKIDLKEIYGKNSKSITRYKGRVIGEKGSFRKKIEEYTNTYICVHDYYILIIGKNEDILTAKEAIEKILNGAKHSTILSFLERKALEKNLILR